jgi:hypothetical protein
MGQMDGREAEIMFRRQIPPSAFRGVVVHPSNRTAVIRKLKSAGLKEVNGIPVEKFVVTEGKF